MKNGSFVRKSDGARVQRWRCGKCGASTSNAIKSPCYRQNKRQLNPTIFKLICSAVSQRRIAMILGISRTTVARKFMFLGAQALRFNQESMLNRRCSRVYLDEMEDRIHTKCKPVAIALAVDENRKILAHRVSRIRPKNAKLNQITRQKYPDWTPNDREGFTAMVKSLRNSIKNDPDFFSDQKRSYASPIRREFPSSHHQQYESRQAVIAGHAELKEGGKDPLFPLNHTCASLRANINRLIRRTWCTSKKISALSLHIEIYTQFHNIFLTP